MCVCVYACVCMYVCACDLYMWCVCESLCVCVGGGGIQGGNVCVCVCLCVLWVCVCASTHLLWLCFVLCFAMVYLPAQFGETAHRRVQHYYNVLEKVAFKVTRMVFLHQAALLSGSTLSFEFVHNRHGSNNKMKMITGLVSWFHKVARRAWWQNDSLWKNKECTMWEMKQFLFLSCPPPPPPPPTCPSSPEHFPICLERSVNQHAVVFENISQNSSLQAVLLVCVCACMHVCKHVHVCVCVCKHACVCVCVCVQACMCVCVQACMCVCVCIHAWLCVCCQCCCWPATKCILFFKKPACDSVAFTFM